MVPVAGRRSVRSRNSDRGAGALPAASRQIGPFHQILHLDAFVINVIGTS